MAVHGCVAIPCPLCVGMVKQGAVPMSEKLQRAEYGASGGEDTWNRRVAIDMAIAKLEVALRASIDADRAADQSRSELDAARRELDALVMG